jgi:hypothetical protein
MAKINLGSIPVGWVFTLDGKKFVRTIEEHDSVKGDGTVLSVCVPVENEEQFYLDKEVDVDDSYADSIPVMNLIMQMGDQKLQELQKEAGEKRNGLELL